MTHVLFRKIYQRLDIVFQDYPGEELLIVYDPDFKYGQNFYLCVTEEAKNKLMRPPSGKEGAGDAEVTEEGEKEDVVYTYKPPEAKEWTTLGSEVDVESEIVGDSRPKVCNAYIDFVPILCLCTHYIRSCSLHIMETVCYFHQSGLCPK